MTGTCDNRALVLDAAQRLLAHPQAKERLQSLVIPTDGKLTGGWSWITLPNWAADLVPENSNGFFLPSQEGVKNWDKYDWWTGAEAMLSSRAERTHEQAHGPVHSYSFRLDTAMHPAFDHAWVNQIILFLRRWWSHNNNMSDEEAFGQIPLATVHLTHDVDAIAKTPAIRVKQSAFNLYNRRFGAAARFMFGGADYWQFDKITQLEAQYNRSSLWNFYGGRGGWLRSPKELLMDPAYCVGTSRIGHQMRMISAAGHRIGLHPRFDTWRDVGRMRLEKSTIEEVLGRSVTEIRQHWLRFSYAETWRAQKAAGLLHDFTLGFNDRPGYRNSAALSFTDSESGMRVTPLVLMDSHLHDYASLDLADRFSKIDQVLDELMATGGEASIVWHQRVFHSDYGWGSTYEYLLDGMKKRRITAPRPE